MTSHIIGTAGDVRSADDVAKICLDGIKCGSFIVSCSFVGVMLSVATAGLSPQSSGFGALLEVLGAGPMRFVGLCFQWNWFTTIKKHTKM